ncbi:(2Fe-2S)-binding protein [Ornithinibacillus halophilus]|uniref:Purine hydroxylase delta subunit apoprotein n=1 Tax=Ornithinibacillus halophilus TaxID=930117 RepID=A0A1M5FNE9_9BACI|nr:(2Fe-2S)-binding protein [Ornithinibacillus halophilus]SHF92702.1 purine hydroxylase delta subunit apoprotein [Ornithinibacillus halophilus]
MKTIRFTVNGNEVAVSSPPTKPLLDVLREELDLTGSKECCGKGECGSCTVMINGSSVCSCLVLVGQVENETVITAEGVGLAQNMDVLQQAFIDEGATQCGYCTPGFIVSAKSFLNQIEHVPTEEEVKTALGGNLCRCTGYTKIIKAVQSAAKLSITQQGVKN